MVSRLKIVAIVKADCIVYQSTGALLMEAVR